MPENRPTRDVELAEYLQHNNSLADKRYVESLERLTIPLLSLLRPEDCGLDYGSGPNPVLADLLKANGHLMSIFDPYFAEDRACLDRQYDFVSCTEVAEHFFAPHLEFEVMVNCLKPGGRIGLMTSPRDPNIEFLDWPYIREKSHVTFYSQTTMSWIAQHFELTPQYQRDSVWIWGRSPVSQPRKLV